MENKRFLKIFSNQNDYDSQKDSVMGMPHVVLLEDTNEVVYASENKEDETDYASQPFTLVALEDGTMDILMPSGATFMNYSLNDGDWIENTEDIALEVKANDNVKLKANAESVIGHYYKIFDLSMPFNAEGNIMSLLYADDFKDKKTIEQSRCFDSTFVETNIVSAKNLILPATTLAVECYLSMFHDCISLTEAPQLPATTLANNCYFSMFYGCISLTEAPQLPATTLANYCYGQMFDSCTSLTTAPELPATTLAKSCYYAMFNRCTSLTTAPELPATTLTESCYDDMFKDCTSLTEAPQLPATTLTNYCYRYMFYGCSKLNYIKMLATDINATYCLSTWVSGVASTGTFVKHPNMTTLPSGVNGIPNGWTVENA